MRRAIDRPALPFGSASRCACAALLLCFVVACGGSHAADPDAAVAIDATPMLDAAVAPVFRNPVALPDDQLARQALGILGADVAGATPTCSGCHGLTRQQLRYWGALSDTAMTHCLTDLAVSSPASAQQMIACMRAMPAVGTSDFATPKLGVYATAARLPWFAYTFTQAFGDAAPAQLAAFQSQAGMPRGGMTPLTQAQFDVVAEYFARGLPLLETVVGQDPPPDTCTSGISAAVGAHVAAMATTGWKQVNADNHMDMYDCGAATDPRQCLADKPATAFAAAGHGTVRTLAPLAYQTAYWTRSSPDGRFVGHGVANINGGNIVDLQRGVTITVAADYDPAFFPDNTGFAFQGGSRNLCPMSVLTSNPLHIALTEPGCKDFNDIGLYEHLGRALGGGDFFSVDSEFVSDNGGHDATLGDPDAAFGVHAYSAFTPLVFQGTTYAQLPQVVVTNSFEGDVVMSPSARLVMSRVAGPGDHQLGYVLRRVDATPAGSTFQIALPEIARYCVSGGKPAFSYDERWLAFHHYITAADAHDLGFADASDPGFAPYLTLGAANLYLMELTTGVVQRITNVAPGQYALYPHFRSDGWIYALVRDTTAGTEAVVASDAAL